MKRTLCLILLLGILMGCAAPQSTLDPGLAQRPYYRQIEEWQQRIRKEGWSRPQVDRVLEECIRFVEYRMELDDHWDTPREFMARGFQGDCEDIAIFLMGTLRRLQYPHGIRIVAVTGWFEGHALLKVEMPDGGWRLYDTAGDGTPFRFHTGYRPVVEFDEQNIRYYDRAS